MTLPERESVTDWIGKTVVDRDGGEIGTVTHLLADEATGAPEWLYADHAGATVVVPLVGATEDGGRVQVAVDRGLVDGAPRYGESRELTTDQEDALYRHYGIEATTDTSETLLPVEGAEPTAPAVTEPAPLPPTLDEEALPSTPPPSVAQPGDRDFGRADETSGGAAGSAGRIAAVVAALLAAGTVGYSVVRRRQQPTVRLSRSTRRKARTTGRKASKKAQRRAGLKLAQLGRKAAEADRKATRKTRRAARRTRAVPATGVTRLQQATAGVAPAVLTATQQVREATRSGAVGAQAAVATAAQQVLEATRSTAGGVGPVVGSAAQQVLDATRSTAAGVGPVVGSAAQQVLDVTRGGAAAAGPAAANAAAQVLGATRRGALAAAPVVAATGAALRQVADDGAVAARQALAVGGELAATAVSRVAEAGAEIGQTGLRAAMRAERAVEKVPEEVAEAGHRLKKKGKRIVRLTAFGLGAGTGYVVGAGYGDYEQIQRLAGRVTGQA